MKTNNKEILVELINVNKNYGNKQVLKDVNLTIHQGDRIGVIGANGNGKTTLTEIISGIRKQTNGDVKRKVGIVFGSQFQDSKYPTGITVMDMITYYVETFKVKITERELDEKLKVFQIYELKDKFIDGLSGGQQQRINILLSLIHDPDIVILDEVSTGLDIEVRNEIFQVIKKEVVEKNKTLILVTHIMEEIAEFCETFIYISNGEIKEQGKVKDIIQEYGSVYNYTWNRLTDGSKKKSLLAFEKAEKPKKANRLDRTIGNLKTNGKNTPLIKLLFKYYIKGFFVPFFVFAFPIILLFLEGMGFKVLGENQLHDLVGSIALIQAISYGIFIIPQTILDFKNSVMMKRIGSTNIKPITFILAVLVVGMVMIVIGFLWTFLWAGIFYGTEFGWSNIAIAADSKNAIPWAILAFFMSMSIGMVMASLFKSSTGYITIANIIYFPIAFLSGMLLPIDIIMNSNVLKYVTYINPFKYAIDPFLDAWRGNFEFKWEYGLYLGIDILLIAGLNVIAAKKLKWQK